MKIAIASDHREKKYKDEVIEYLKEQKYNVDDCSPENTPTDDYPDYAFKVCKKVVAKKATTKKENQVEKKLVLNQEKALAVTLVVLAILVVILLVIALVQKNKSKDLEKSSITIPVLEENVESRIAINLSELSETKEYVFIVSNYKDNDINKKSIEYDVEITNNDNVRIEIYKNGKMRNALDDDYEVEDNKLAKNKKQEDVYKLVIKDTKNIKNDSQLVIEIDS